MLGSVAENQNAIVISQHSQEGMTRSLASLLPRVSLIIPARNEADNLRHVLPLIPKWLHEVIIVDGNSSDNTAKIVRSLMPGARVIDQEKPGKGAALRTGFHAATGDLLVAMDADGSADPREIMAYVGAIMAGADYAKGSRFLQGGFTSDMEWYRRLGNWCLMKLVQVIYGGRFTDLCYGYNALRKSALPYLDLDKTDGFEVETQMNVRALQAGLEICEIPSKEYLRLHGKSNLNTIRDGWRVLHTIIRLAFSFVPPAKGRDKRPSKLSDLLAGNGH